jgi:hypothetical protein
MASASIDELETYLVWMALNYDSNLSDFVQNDGTRTKFQSDFLCKLSNLPYQFSDINSNKRTPNKRLVDERTFLYSKLNDILNDIISRSVEEITRCEDQEKNLEKRINIFNQTTKSPFLAKDPITNIKIKLERQEPKSYHRYKMLLIGKAFNVNDDVININEQAKKEDQNRGKVVSPNTYTYPLVAKTLYPYYSKILQQFQELCAILKQFKNVKNNPNQSRQLLNTFFSKFRDIMTKRILGAIQEDAIIQNNVNTLVDTTTNFEYTLKINGFYDSYYMQVLINFIALRKVLHDYFRQNIDTRLITNLNGIGILTDVYRLPSFLSYYDKKIKELKKSELAQANTQANTLTNTQANTQANQMAKSSKLSLVQASYNNNQKFQDASKSLVDMPVKKSIKNVKLIQENVNTQQTPNFNSIEMTSGQSSSETTKAISQELQQRIDFTVPNFTRLSTPNNEQANQDGENQDGKNIDQQDNTNIGQDKDDNVASVDVNSSQKESSNTESSNILIWTSLGIVGLIGAGLYWKHKQTNKTK